ncbi:MAG: ABC transporter ATP-binding protein [Firmicutes bacterium]|nr:ABC transporter ATP-binding protein [Bacillota bacterium]
MARLSIEHVSKVFSDRPGEVQVVLNDVSFDIEDGEFVCLLGPSGCGKTTLLTMMGGFQEPTEGQICLDGEPISGPSPERGYVFQNYALFPWMTVEKNVAYGLKFQDLPEAEKKARVDAAIEMAHLTEHRKKFPIQLSGGMQQRCAVARALVGRPKVLLLDEPLGAVDFQMRELMQNELERMVQEAGITVVMVTHDVSESVFFSDRVIVFGRKEGEIVGNVTIDLPRTRDRSSEEYEHYVSHLTNLLRDAFKGASIK